MEFKPREILVEEHVIIQKMLKCLEILEKNLEKNSLQLLDIIIDFFRIYADKCHHGKEEDILFARLKKKPLKDDEKKLLEELIEEHKQGRKLVSRLEELKIKKDILQIREIINKMLSLYIQHIEKENTRFFVPAFNYFSKEEKKQIIYEFMQVDKKVVNEKYLKIINDFESLIKK